MSVPILEFLTWGAWWLLTATCLVPFWLWIKRTGEVLSPLPMFLATVALYVLPRSAYLLIFHRPPDSSAGFPESRQLEIILTTLLIITAGALAFVAAFHTPRRSLATSIVRFPKLVFSRALLVSAIAFAVGFAALFILLRQMGGWRYVLEHQHMVSRLLQGKGILLTATRALLLPVGLLLINPDRREARRWVWLLALVAAFGYALLGRRALIAFAIAYPVLLYHWCVRPFKPRLVLPVAVAAALLLTSYSYVRLLGTTKTAQAYKFAARHPQTTVHFLFSTGEFRIFDAASIIIRDVPSIRPLNFGSNFVRVPWWGIPRTAWKTKPITLGEELVQTYMPTLKAGHPPMAFGELYAAGGTAAVVLGMLLLGLIARIVWDWATDHRGLAESSLYILFCYFVYDFTRVGDPSRTVWGLLLGAFLFLGAFALAARPHRLKYP